MRFANNAVCNNGQYMTGKVITVGLGVDGIRKR